MLYKVWHLREKSDPTTRHQISEASRNFPSKAQVAQPKSSSKAAFKRKVAEEASNDTDKFKTKRLKEAATFNSKKEIEARQRALEELAQRTRKSERPNMLPSTPIRKDSGKEKEEDNGIMSL